MTQSPNTNILVDLYFFLRGLIETAEWFNKDVLSSSGWRSDVWGAGLGSSSSAAPVGENWPRTRHALQQRHSAG